MDSISKLTKSKLEIARELNHAKIDSTGDSKLADIAEKLERDKMIAFIKTQEKEIAVIRNEISLLRRKDVAQSLTLLPAPPGKQTSILPPISMSGESRSGNKTGTK